MDSGFRRKDGSDACKKLRDDSGTCGVNLVSTTGMPGPELCSPRPYTAVMVMWDM